MSPDLMVFADAGGPALVGGVFVFLAVVFLGLGLLVGLVVYLIARSRARRKLAPPPGPGGYPPGPPYPPAP